MSEDDKIKPIGVKFKAPPGEVEPTIKIVGGTWVDRDKCNHNSYYRDGQRHEINYLIREGETECECANCGTRLDPMFVLKVIANREGEALRLREIAAREMAKLHERSRTKCRHCGKMTEISRN